MISSLFRKLSHESRARKMGLLRERVSLRPGDRILDLGSQLDDGPGLLLESQVGAEAVVACNIDRDHLDRIGAALPGVGLVLADGRRLPFADKSFDLVFSNAVIEHVGGIEDQTLMASEIQRVGKRWFITTPNRWFPFEFHTRMPFYSWLPAKTMTRAAHLWSYNHVAGRYQHGIRRAHTRLMTCSELRRVFPSSSVLPIQVTVWPETLVVIGPD